MSTPFLGQISMFSFGFAPRGYAVCNGQLLAISQHARLHSLIGNMYGGNGTTQFALPDLRGRAGVKFSPASKQGTAAGAEGHTLQMSEMPSHQHTFMASGSGADAVAPQGRVLAASTNAPYAPIPAAAALNPDTIPKVGGDPHDNMQPFLTINFAIALIGIPPVPPTES